MVIGKVGSLLRLIGVIWIGFGLIGMVAIAFDRGVFEGHGDEDTALAMIGAALPAFIPGLVLLALGGAMRKRLTQLGLADMSFREARTKAGAMVALHNARELARLAKGGPPARTKEDRLKQVAQALDEAWPNRPRHGQPPEDAAAATSRDRAKERPAALSDRDRAPTVAARSKPRRSVVER